METRLFVEELKRLLVSCEYNESMDFCRTNMRTAIPKVLYRYTPINDRSVENLQNFQLHLSNPRKFNDLFDCWLNKEQAIECLLRENKKALNLDVTSIQDVFYRSINDGISTIVRVGCLSEVCPTNTIMWNHYGDTHNGMCLEYDFSDCIDDYCNIIRPVFYSDAPLVIKPDVFKYDTWSGNMLLLVILSKSNKWAYEEEWRIVRLLQEPSDNVYLQPIPCLKHIYIGTYADKCSNGENDREYNKRLALLGNVVKFAQKNSIPITQMERCL